MKIAAFTESEETFDLKKNVLLFWRHKWLVLNILIITLTAVSIYVFRLPDVYTTSAQIFIEDIPAPIVQAQSEDIALRSMADRYYSANIAMLKSAPVTQAVVQQMGLAEKLSASQHRFYDANQAMGVVQKAVAISYKDFVYTISATYAEPFMAASIANTLTKAFVKQYIERRLYISKELKELFPKEAQELEKHTSQGQLEDLSHRELVMQLPSVRSDPTAKALEEKKYLIQNEISKLSLRYKEKHPKMIEVRASLYFTNERLNARIDEIVSDLKENLVTRFQESNIRILSEASVPGAPSGPQRLKIILIAGMIALMGSLGLVYLLDSLDDKINNEDDLEQYIQLPYLGAIFKIKKVKDEKARDVYLLQEPLSETAEAFKNLRVNINFATALEHRKTLLITSSVPEEGKTFITANLAISKAQDEKKVLLVDADLRRPKIHKSFNLENKIGFSNILTSNISYDSAIQRTTLENLDIITSGPPSPNPPELFNSKAMMNFLDAVTKKYDIVLFDAPPGFNIPDVLVLGSVLGALVLVVYAHKTPYKVILKTKQHLQSKGIRIIGAVLNNLERAKEKAPYYHEYYAHGYTYTSRKGDAS